MVDYRRLWRGFSFPFFLPCIRVMFPRGRYSTWSWSRFWSFSPERVIPRPLVDFRCRFLLLASSNAGPISDAFWC